MKEKVRVYLDGPVNVTGFKDLHSSCKFILSPYDSRSQCRSDIDWELAIPSEMQWRDWNINWANDHFSWSARKDSGKLSEIYAIIGRDPKERRDGLHLDSAYKSGAQIFLTSDKGDVWKNRIFLEPLLELAIFHPDTEIDTLRKHIYLVIGDSRGK